MNAKLFSFLLFISAIFLISGPLLLINFWNKLSIILKFFLILISVLPISIMYIYVILNNNN